MSLQGEFQRKLYKELIKNYNPLERPVANDSQPLTVYFSLSLLQIMDVVSPARPQGCPLPAVGSKGSRKHQAARRCSLSGTRQLAQGQEGQNSAPDLSLLAAVCLSFPSRRRNPV